MQYAVKNDKTKYQTVHLHNHLMINECLVKS